MFLNAPYLYLENERGEPHGFGLLANVDLHLQFNGKTSQNQQSLKWVLSQLVIFETNQNESEKFVC